MTKPKLYKQRSDDCWRISLCNYFNLPPKKVPHFVKLYGEDFVGETRKWLNKMGKTLTFVPFDSFLGTGLKFNRSLFPEGKCIACLGNAGRDQQHACLMVDGELFEERTDCYDFVCGYFIIHDLNG